MATLILGTVGRVIGGPIGGLVGTLLGGTIDRGLFGSGATRDGPRLGNLDVQSAGYGEPLPRIYGRMRAAGNLVWTAGIKEAQSRSGGGKSGPATNTYSYSSSFAVIVSARPIVRIERIWADGKLLRSDDGTLNFPATIRTYLGDESQAVDPLIAAVEGADAAPAYRGLAYLVFEDLPLADYGNRIPNLTFEVVADDAPVGIDAIAVDLGGGLLTAQGAFPTVVGFAAAQAGAIRQALTSLGTVADLALGDDGSGLRIGVGTSAATLADTDLGAGDGSAATVPRQETRAADTAVPDAVWLSYSDTARDYQTGIQAATRRTPALRIDQRDLTIAAGAADAKGLAAAALRRAIAAQTTSQLALPWRYAAIRPGDIVLAPADPLPWRVTHRTITGAVIDCEIERVADLSQAAASLADSGRSYAPPDTPQGPTILHLLDLPALPGPLPTVPQLLVAAGGSGSGWRRADIMVSRDDGETYQFATTIGAPATIGTAVTSLAPGPTTCWDRRSTVNVELAADDADLQSTTEAAVLAGANLAAIGTEIIQFALATQIGARRFRLSTLLRGRRGSEAAVSTHAAGDRFVLLDTRIVSIDLTAEAIGAPLRIKAVGPGEDVAATAAQVVVPQGIGLRPLSPATVTVTHVTGGDQVVSWIRRSRAGYAWADGTDVPIAEDSERYRIIVRDGDVVLRSTDVGAPAWTYAAADRAGDAPADAALTVAIAQVSAVMGAGPATIATLY